MIYQNDLLLRAARGEEVERAPVWVMRQAGRVLPEYRAVRKEAGSFKGLLMNPELAAEVTIQPVNLLGVDAAILFSDILVIPEALGLEYHMDEGKGPWFPRTISAMDDLTLLNAKDVVSNLEYVRKTIKRIISDLDGRIPLIGFAGAPWTILCYMIEGRGSKTFSKTRSVCYSNPELAHALLAMITEATIAYLKMQIAEGCAIVQIFDSWAGILNKEIYDEFGLKYISKICDQVQEVPVTVFSKGAFFALEDLGRVSCRTVGLDWHIDPSKAREVVGPLKTLQGNLDPAVLYGDFDQIKKKTAAMLDAFGRQRYIVNLGHGVYPDIRADHLKCFIDYTKEHQYKS
jgi:uroporphyrinogen decarboxylase